MTEKQPDPSQNIRTKPERTLEQPDVALRLIEAEEFSDRIRLCRIDCLAEDGRFTREQIAGISSDEFDHRSLHGVATLNSVD